jgi:hypothetical protein
MAKTDTERAREYRARLRDSVLSLKFLRASLGEVLAPHTAGSAILEELRDRSRNSEDIDEATKTFLEENFFSSVDAQMRLAISTREPARAAARALLEEAGPPGLPRRFLIKHMTATSGVDRASANKQLQRMRDDYGEIREGEEDVIMLVTYAPKTTRRQPQE